MRFFRTRSTSFSTTRRSPIHRFIAALVAALVIAAPLAPARAALDIDPLQLYRQMKAAYDKGAANGWHLGDQDDYFSAVLDAGRGYELRRRDDPQNLAIQGITVDLASLLSYDPLISNDAAEWYVRLAATSWTNDPQRGSAARAIIAKLDAEDAAVATLAHDADADAAALVQKYPGDVQALLGQVDADLRAYNLTRDPSWRGLAITRAAQPSFPIGSVPQDLGRVLFPMVDAARNAGPGYSAEEREAAAAVASHRASAHGLPMIGHVVSHDTFLVITAPADEYFGRTRLSPIGVRNELSRITKYLDAGWGDRMTKDTVYVIDSLDDWQHQYPRDYELPRLYKRVFDLLGREDSTQAKQAQKDVRRTLLVNYPNSAEARDFYTS